MVCQYDKMDQLYNVFVRHGIIGGHQCRITKTVETPTACDTTTLRQDIHNRLGEISVYFRTISEVIGEISKKIKIYVINMMSQRITKYIKVLAKKKGQELRSWIKWPRNSRK